MGRIIQKGNGKTTVYVTGVNIGGLAPASNTYYLGVDLTTGLYEKLNPSGAIINLESSGGGSFTGGTVNGATNFTNGLSTNTFSATTYLNLPQAGVVDVTYSGLTDLITTSGLSNGSYYLITDFQTCYDQPDFDYDGNPISIGNYKQGPVEPLMVLATSVNTISNQAYQSMYPNDKITYDWAYSTTEVTSGVAYGRISERIDEFNNRTDYDHRTILFKRYRLYTYRQDQPLNGTIEITSTNLNNVTGTTTQFTNLSVGDVIYVPGTNPSYFEVVHISGDTLMSITGDTLSGFGSGFEFYKAIVETNDSDSYFSYKRTNINLNDFVEYTTFGDAINQNYAKNNFVGNYANDNQNVGYGFILANNVFLEGGYNSNKFGDYCYNNTFGSDNSSNIWGDWCYENVSTNDIDDNIIGHNFNRNLINVNLTSNHIGNDFNNNKLLAQNSENFEDNIIGNGFNNNTIYSWFYKNEILDNFNENVIGDFGNKTNLEFYRNYIRNNFNRNTIKNNYQNNQIGTNFQTNEINSEFIGNTVLNGFNNNTIGNYFGLNNIGNGFNNNTIYDNFSYNSTDYYFNSNTISNDFTNNNIGTYFQSNRPSNITLFGWGDLSTVSSRTYNTFINSVGGGQLGNRVLGKEFVMRIISTSQYFKIKFTQWTQGGNGGGFKYTREEIDSSGNSLGSFVTFAKTNNGNEVDVIVPGVVEITRGVNNGIYNIVSEGGWNSSVSPDDTEWNSVYTQTNSGERFGYNEIGNNFTDNIIGSDFGYGGGQAQGNRIGDVFQSNTIGQYAYNNVIGNEFKNNTIGDNFEDNTIKNYFIGNTILDGFEGNEIGYYFGNNASGPGSPIQNIIFDNFKYNKIGNFFGNDTNYPSVGSGSNGDGGVIINNGFQFNVIGDNFIFSAIDLNFSNNKVGDNFWFNVFGQNTENNVIGNFFVGNSGVGGFSVPIANNFISNNLNNYFGFNEIGGNFQYNKIGNFFGNAGLGTQNVISGIFTNNQIGNYFGDDGTATSGGNIMVDFYDNVIGNEFYSNTIVSGFTQNEVKATGLNSIDFTLATHVYGNYNCTIFRRGDTTDRLSYYDLNDVLNIVNTNA